MGEIADAILNGDMTKEEWLNLLLDFAEGKREWDTGEIWVCEGHPRLPFEMGLPFDCQCGGPGMPPEGSATATEIVEILKGWRDVVNGKALIKAEPGAGPFIADLCRRGLRIIEASERKEGYDCPIHGNLGEEDCPRC